MNFKAGDILIRKISNKRLSAETVEVAETHPKKGYKLKNGAHTFRGFDKIEYVEEEYRLLTPLEKLL